MLAKDTGWIGRSLCLQYMLDGLRACCACNRCWMEWQLAMLTVDAGWIGRLLCLQYMLDGLRACCPCNRC